MPLSTGKVLFDLAVPTSPRNCMQYTLEFPIRFIKRLKYTRVTPDSSSWTHAPQILSKRPMHYWTLHPKLLVIKLLVKDFLAHGGGRHLLPVFEEHCAASRPSEVADGPYGSDDSENEAEHDSCANGEGHPDK